MLTKRKAQSDQINCVAGSKARSSGAWTRGMPACWGHLRSYRCIWATHLHIKNRNLNKGLWQVVKEVSGKAAYVYLNVCQVWFTYFVYRVVCLERRKAKKRERRQWRESWTVYSAGVQFLYFGHHAAIWCIMWATPNRLPSSMESGLFKGSLLDKVDSLSGNVRNKCAKRSRRFYPAGHTRWLLATFAPVRDGDGQETIVRLFGQNSKNEFKRITIARLYNMLAFWVATFRFSNKTGDLFSEESSPCSLTWVGCDKDAWWPYYKIMWPS